MPATGGGDASFLRDISDGKGKLLVDRDGLPHFGGAEDWLDDWDQVCEDYFYGLKADERKHAASRVKGKLFDNAKLLTKADAGVSYEKIEAMAETKAREALKLIQTTVRSRCEKAKVINEKDAFVGYFFKSHKRKWGENPPAFQQRRDDEYAKMEHRVGPDGAQPECPELLPDARDGALRRGRDQHPPEHREQVLGHGQAHGEPPDLARHHRR